MRWQYRPIMLRAGGVVFGGAVDGQELTDRLNELGAEGWELVTAFDTNMAHGRTRDVLAVLKREGQGRERGRG
jgi:hypothetical protein